MRLIPACCSLRAAHRHILCAPSVFLRPRGGLGVQQHLDRFRAINPVVKAPTLVCDDGETIMDSPRSCSSPRPPWCAGDPQARGSGAVPARHAGRVPWRSPPAKRAQTFTSAICARRNAASASRGRPGHRPVAGGLRRPRGRGRPPPGGLRAGPSGRASRPPWPGSSPSPCWRPWCRRQSTRPSSTFPRALEQGPAFSPSRPTDPACRRPDDTPGRHRPAGCRYQLPGGRIWSPNPVGGIDAGAPRRRHSNVCLKPTFASSPGSMSEPDTPERILDAAERLSWPTASRPPPQRMITAEAKANLAAVNYHFGGKEG